MEISLKPSFFLCPGRERLEKVAFEIVGDYEADSTFILSRYLSSTSLTGTGIGVASETNARRVDYIYVKTGCEEKEDDSRWMNVLKEVEDTLGLKVTTTGMMSSESRSVNEMTAHDRGALLRAYIIHKMLDDDSAWYRFSRDDDDTPANMSIATHGIDDEDEEEKKEGEETTRHHIRVITLGEILVPEQDPSNIGVLVGTTTYRVKKTSAFCQVDDGNPSSIVTVVNAADGSVYRPIENPKRIPAPDGREEDFLTGLEIRNRGRGYLAYLRVGSPSLRTYWQLRAGIDVVHAHGLELVRVASLNCRYREYDSRVHPEFPGAECFLPTAVLSSPPVQVPFRSRVDRESTLRLFLADLCRCCADSIEVKATSTLGGEGAMQPKTRSIHELVLSSALSVRGKKDGEVAKEQCCGTSDEEDSMDSA